MKTRNKRVNLDGKSTTTNGNVRFNTRGNAGRQTTANVGVGTPQVDTEAMYRFFVNMMQTGAAAGLVGGNARGANQEVPDINNYTVLNRDYARLRGKLFIGTEDAIEAENRLFIVKGFSLILA